MAQTICTRAQSISMADSCAPSCAVTQRGALRRLATALLFLAALIIQTIPARADYATSRVQFYSLNLKARVSLQMALVWVGDYNKIIDGRFGRGTYEALVNFQAANGFLPTGVLNSNQAALLLSRAMKFSGAVGFRTLTDAATGLQFGIPARLLDKTAPAKFGTRWFRSDGSIEIETIRMSAYENSFEGLYQKLSADTAQRHVTYQVDRGSFFVVSGTTGRNRFYLRFEHGQAASVGFSISWDPVLWPAMDRVVVAMSSLARIGSSPADTSRQGAVAQGTEPKAPKAARNWSGSGFFVTPTGVIATNAHVVDGCNQITVKNYGLAEVLRSDKTNDIAFIKPLAFGQVAPVARFRKNPPQLGEKVIVVGFPLSDILGGSLNITDGIISSLSGVGGDTRYIQITAPVQNGNSGGPLLDASGNVIGIVSAKLNDLMVLKEEGAVPQGVNFAVRATLLGSLADATNVTLKRESSSQPLSVSDIAKEAEQFTVQIICRNN